jgi:GNAT superfamily N-acetyltransferase
MRGDTNLMNARIDIGAPGEADLDTIHAFLTESYWAPGIPRDLVARACGNSVCAIARDDRGEVIGFARAATDRATFAWLCDVFVLPAHREKGIARALVRTLMAHPDLRGLRRWLLATRDAHGVYAPLGFEPLAAPERWMEISSPAPYGRARA